MKQRTASPNDKLMGQRIRARRIELKISQDELGEALGISFQQIQKYEKGVNRVSATRMMQIAKVLQTTPEALMGAGSTEAANPHALSMLATRDGAYLAQAFNEICDDDRKLLVNLARSFVAINARFVRAAE